MNSHRGVKLAVELRPEDRCRCLQDLKRPAQTPSPRARARFTLLALERLVNPGRSAGVDLGLATQMRSVSWLMPSFPEKAEIVPLRRSLAMLPPQAPSGLAAWGEGVRRRAVS